jgi:hypothetical protein
MGVSDGSSSCVSSTTLAAEGASCASDSDCDYGLTCQDYATHSTGTCKPSLGPPTFAQPGEPCGMTAQGWLSCSEYYACEPSSSLCVRLAPALGESCAYPAEACFQDDAYCDTSTFLCTAKHADGADCSDTGLLGCAGGWCDMTTDTCTTLPLCY